MFLAIDIDAGSKSGSKDVPAVIDRILDKAHPDTFEILVTSGKSYEFNGEGRFIRHTDNDVHDPADLRSRKFDFLSNNLVLSSCGTVRSLLSSECQMLDDQDLPKLVLSCSLWYPFKDMSKWHAITHQCHGMICNHIEMLVMDLNPKLEVQKSMIELSRKWLDSEAAFDHVRLSTVNEYREDVISMFGIDCEFSHSNFGEAVYPLDCTVENIRSLTTDTIPDRLDDLIEWEGLGDFQRFAGSMNRWSLYILGENSD